jgi:site-specific DNA-methyltransferase (adenine-specific)
MSAEVIHGDCLNVMPTLAVDSVDAVVTSPPYAMQRKKQYGGIPEADYPAWTVAWLAALRPALKERGSVLLNIREHVKDGQISDYVHHTRLAARAAGWIECDEIIWNKRGSPPVVLTEPTSLLCAQGERRKIAKDRHGERASCLRCIA